MRSQTANIEDVKIGDLVYSYDTQTGETELAEVTATFALTSNHINYLTIIDENGDEQVIETTDAHPFWVVTDEPDLERAARSIVDENGVWLYHENISPTENGFWVEAKDLRIGDVFLGANCELSTLTNIVRVEQSGGIAVFNFTVEGNHNYFILAKEYDYGQTCVLVHNACWSKGKHGDSVKNALGHWKKHKKEFPELNNAKEYAEKAKDMVSNAPLTKTRPNGDTLHYDPNSNTFVVALSDGTPKTMFRPKTAMIYWNQQ